MTDGPMRSERSEQHPGSNRFRRYEWALALVLIAAVAACYWAWRGKTGWGGRAWQADLYAAYAPMIKYLVQSLGKGELPLWNPYQALGQPFLAYPMGTFYPPSWLCFVLPMPVALHLLGILHLVAAGLFAYLFCRTLRLSFVSSLAGGLSFLLCGTVLHHASWTPIHIGAIVWIPLAFVCVTMLFEQGSYRWALGLAATCAVQMLAGFPQFSLYMYYGLAAYALVLAASKYRETKEWKPAARLLGLCAGAMVLGALVASVQLLPLRELASRSLRLGLGSRYLVGPKGKRALAEAGVRMFLVRRIFKPASHIIVLGAVLAGLFHRRRRDAVFFGALVAVSVLLAAGPGTWLYDIYTRLPTGAMFAHPIRFGVLFSFGIAVLTAMGLDLLGADTSRVRGTHERCVRSQVGKVVVYVAALVLCASLIPEVMLKRGWIWGTVLVAAAVCVRMLTDGRLPWRAVTVAMAVLLTAQLARSFHPPLSLQLDESVYEASRSTFAYLREHQGLSRAVIVRQEKGDFGFADKLGALHKVYVFRDYDALQDRRISRYVSYLNAGKLRESRKIPRALPVPGKSALRLLNLAGVKHVVVRQTDEVSAISEKWEKLADEGDESGSVELRLVFANSDVKIYENLKALPRAYFVPEVQLVTDEEEMLRRLASAGFDANRCALVEDASLLGAPREGTTEMERTTVEGSVEVNHYASRDVRLSVEAPSEGFVILTDLHYPGWRAEVGGRPAKIHRANYLFRAVRVPSGRHEVRFAYRGDTFYKGAALSTGAVAILVGFTALASRRRGDTVWRRLKAR